MTIKSSCLDHLVADVAYRNTSNDSNSNSNELSVSFEFFPPNTEKLAQQLWKAMVRLAPLNPSFVSVTYGASGSTRERTFNTVKRIISDTDLVPAAHLTCVGASKNEIRETAAKYWDIGVRHIVALRGDPPKGQSKHIAPNNGYNFSSELVADLKTMANFEISVAAYPEVHPEALSAECDLDNLKQKIDAGATRAITQFFFDVDIFLRFRDRTTANGINVPLVPGILPVTNFAQLVKFSSLCGTTLPTWLISLFEGLDEDPEIRRLISSWIAIEQCQKLIRNGVDSFHFYTLNRAELSRAICHALGIRPIVSKNDAS